MKYDTRGHDSKDIKRKVHAYIIVGDLPDAMEIVKVNGNRKKTNCRMQECNTKVQKKKKGRGGYHKTKHTDKTKGKDEKEKRKKSPSPMSL